MKKSSHTFFLLGQKCTLSWSRICRSSCPYEITHLTTATSDSGRRKQLTHHAKAASTLDPSSFNVTSPNSSPGAFIIYSPLPAMYEFPSALAVVLSRKSMPPIGRLEQSSSVRAPVRRYNPDPGFSGRGSPKGRKMLDLVVGKRMTASF